MISKCSNCWLRCVDVRERTALVNRWDVRLGDFCLFCLVSCSTRNVGSEQSRIISSKSTSVCVFFPVGIYSLKDYQWHAWSLLEPHFHLAVAPKSFGGLSELTPSTLFPHLANRIAKVRWAQLGSGKRKNDGEADHRACSVILSECRLSTSLDFILCLPGLPCKPIVMRPRPGRGTDQ